MTEAGTSVRGLVAGFRVLGLWAPAIGFFSLYLLPEESRGSLAADALPSLLACWCGLGGAYVLERLHLGRRAAGPGAVGALELAVGVAGLIAAVVIVFFAMVAGVGPDV